MKKLKYNTYPKDKEERDRIKMIEEKIDTLLEIKRAPDEKVIEFWSSKVRDPRKQTIEHYRILTELNLKVFFQKLGEAEVEYGVHDERNAQLKRH